LGNPVPVLISFPQGGLRTHVTALGFGLELTNL